MRRGRMAFYPLDAPYDPNNAFARIMRGELPASRVWEDDATVVIMPLQWEHPGHAHGPQTRCAQPA